MPDFTVAILSYGRAGNVKTLGLFPDAAICVRAEQLEEYQAAHPDNEVIVQTQPGASGARNTILDTWNDRDILMMDDDVSSIKAFVARPGQKGKYDTVSLDGDRLVETLNKIFSSARSLGAYHWGVSPTSNPLFYNAKKPVSTNHFVNGSMTGYLAGIDIRFDLALIHKEDYDFTVQAWLRYGIVLRFNSILTNAAHRSNKGGACEYRTDETERESIRVLVEKWGDFIRPNPKRANEVILTLKGS
jgi:hypothetical protein